MKVKHALIVLAAGYCMQFTGALFKLEHWVSADALIIAATVCIACGILILLYKLLTYLKFKDFLNW